MKSPPFPQNPLIETNGAMSRRRFVTLTGSAAAGFVWASCSSDGGSHTTATAPSTEHSVTSTNDSTSTGSPTAATTPSGRPVLSIPQRLEGSVFDLEMGIGEREFLPGLSTATKGYNGDFLGPTLFVRSGRDVALNVTNNIDVVTTTHWHGIHLPAVMDGGPHQPIEPGETWHAAFRVMNRAGTYWYHPHPHADGGLDAVFEPDSTGYQVYEGLAGLLIIEDDVSDALPLPRSYGQDDIPLILQDRRFNDDGSFLHFPDDFGHDDSALRKGGHFLVNGVEGAVLEVGAQIVRFRVLNGSNSRIYNLGFSDDRTFYQIASDGGFLAGPVAMSRLVISPGERAELLIDLSVDEGQTLTLGSYNADNGQSFVPIWRQDQWDTADFELLEIHVGPATADAVTSIPAVLTDVDRIPPSDAVNAANPRRFELRVDPFLINGRAMDKAVINERISLGDTEIWEITNPNHMAHPFHVHGDSFQILSRNGSTPPDHELGWKDVVLTRPFETVRIIKRFNDYTDPEVPYMYHCHLLEHEDAGMMGQWIVVDA